MDGTTPPYLVSAPLRRIAAAVYDVLPATSVVFAAAAVAVAVLRDAVAAGNPFFQAYLLTAVFLYFAGFWIRAGYTPGMRSWKTRIVTVDGRRPGWTAVLIRYLVGWVSVLCLGLGFLWAFWDRDRLMWHDRASGTRIVRDETLYKKN
ncbi:MAG: RDD family protein [Pseudomonadota bacterium]